MSNDQAFLFLRPQFLIHTFNLRPHTTGDEF